MYKVVKHCCDIKNFPKYLSSKYSSVPPKVHSAKLNFNDFVSQRQEQAMRSIVVQVFSERSFPELYNYCSAYGNIIGGHHYCLEDKQIEQMHFILLEYENSQQANEALNSSAHNEKLEGVPARSPFLYFRPSDKKAVKNKTIANQEYPNLLVVNGSNVIGQDNLISILRSCPNIELQITELYERTKLNDIGIRLRFLAAYQVQNAITAMFPCARALPFGSSVNGFGKMDCDLDLILRLDEEDPEEKRKPNSRLVFHTKVTFTDERSQTQKQLGSISDILKFFLPGVGNVRRILEAKVPIIKYRHEYLNLDIDLSMSNLSGFYMSELLYMLGKLDERVIPLVFCIRRWASACGLTNPSPGRWISNFSLTCLVIFFLQQVKKPVLPSINKLIKSATKDDIRLTEDGVNCTFARDFRTLNFVSHNTSKASELLLQFFEYYSQFDFQNKAISLNEGRAITKPNYSALYIVNPLEQLSNVSRNVSIEECERFRIEVRNGACILESELENYHIIDMDKSHENWGLLRLFKTPGNTIIKPHLFFKPRILEVSDLFDKTEATNMKASNSVSSDSIDFKNNRVKQQVDNIKATARQHIKQMRINSSSPASASKTVYSSDNGSKRTR